MKIILMIMKIIEIQIIYLMLVEELILQLTTIIMIL
nr:MAG TPA: hypothetical protein [Crassvirales sp.]